MKTYKIIVVLLLLVSVRATAQNWTKITSTFNPAGYNLSSSGVFTDENNGWWAKQKEGGKYSIFHTTDGGTNWFTQLDSIGFYNITFADKNNGWITGGIAYPYASCLWITKTGGTVWEKYNIPNIFILTFLDSLNGFAGGVDSLYSTVDGGITWKPMSIEPNSKFIIWDISFSDIQNGWAVGKNETGDGMVIINTTDSGKTWSLVDIKSEYAEVVRCFKNPPRVYILGIVGLTKITKEGESIIQTHYLEYPSIYDIVFISDSIGWVVGDMGFIGYTSDGGENWAKVESGTTSRLFKIFFFNDGKTGYILGDDNVLLKYTSPVGVNEFTNSKTLSYRLIQNYPNPFNPSTKIKYELPQNSFVTIKVFDVTGREVGTLVNQQETAGYHEINFDGRNLSNGIYFYSITAIAVEDEPVGNSGFRSVKKMILLK